jgi:hypothetical protein
MEKEFRFLKKIKRNVEFGSATPEPGHFWNRWKKEIANNTTGIYNSPIDGKQFKLDEGEKIVLEPADYEEGVSAPKVFIVKGENKTSFEEWIQNK